MTLIWITKILPESELKAVQDKIVKLQAFDSDFFCSKSHF